MYRSMLKIAYSPIYRYALPPKHRFPMDKYTLLPEQLIYEGTLTDDNFFEPPPLDDEDILLTHTRDYVSKLNTQTLSKKEIRAIGFPMTENLIHRGKHIANGTYLAAQYALQHGIGMNIAGGTHHSFRDHGEGFCIFNDFAICANLMLHNNEVKNILIVDLDVHQGNGTAKIFEHDARVFTFSMHGAKNYPHRKETSDLDIALPDGTNDRAYLDILYRTLPDLIQEQEPDLICYLSGVDVLESDKLGRLSMTKMGCKERDRFVLTSCQEAEIPVVVAMGGGYSPMIRDIIDAHANTYRLAQELFF